MTNKGNLFFWQSLQWGKQGLNEKNKVFSLISKERFHSLLAWFRNYFLQIVKFENNLCKNLKSKQISKKVSKRRVIQYNLLKQFFKALCR